jgi:hypothetical protein
MAVFPSTLFSFVAALLNSLPLFLFNLSLKNSRCYSGERDLKAYGSRPASAKSSALISTNGWVWWLVPVIPAMQGSTHRRIVVLAEQSIK